ncbi:MAG: 3'(2'),5'-bisphosphate nucleotidase CysQ [Corallincola sp.]|nr:3'(2'),5'-bisphosphate nucleotidase CysQ [Corallincola sp.]
MSSPLALLNDLRALAVEAGEIIAGFYHSGRYEEQLKGDETPVTSADLAAHAFLARTLRELEPDTPVLSEEDAGVPFAQRQRWSRYFLIDPLDGTSEFVAGSGDFAVSIALMEAGQPVAGVIHAPILGVSYFALRGAGVFRAEGGRGQPIAIARRQPGEAITVAISRRQPLAPIRQQLQIDREVKYLPFGGATLKCCLVAEGIADCYLRLGPTGEWDTAAAQCILSEAGGRVVDTRLQPLPYNHDEGLGNPDFIAIGDDRLPWAQWLRPSSRLRTGG